MPTIDLKSPARHGTSPAAITSLSHGIRANATQFILQLTQVFFVGLTVGMTRTVVPAVAEQEFGLPKDAIDLLVTFVIAFGVVKGSMNFVAGRISERLGRKRVLVIGWLVALPIPFMIRYGPTWNWIVAATVLLGINQGLTWSMALTSKLDLTRPQQRGLANGLNEFFGYSAVAIAGVVTGYISDALGARMGLFIFGLAVIVPALAMALLLVRDTRPWAEREEAGHALRETALTPALSQGERQKTTTEVFQLTWRDRRFFAVCQAGMVEKFTDALMWVFFPVFLRKHAVDVAHIGWIPGVYAIVWGVSQLVTGPLSDRIGRRKPIALGMFLCGAGVGMMLLRDGFGWWSMCAAITGFGMALVYPTLGAAVSDIASPLWRGSALGVYRFWRDLGYAVGALGLGLAAHFAHRLEIGFWLVAISMIVSTIVFLAVGRETLPERTPSASR